MPRPKQTTIDRWSRKQLIVKLAKCSVITGKTRIPIILFRNTIEEAESAQQEEIAIKVRKYIIIVVYSVGGFIPATFDRVRVFTAGEFVAWIMRRNRQLLLQINN